MLPILQSFLVILVILTLLYSFIGVCKTCSTKHKNEVSLGNQIEVEIRGTFMLRSCTSHLQKDKHLNFEKTKLKQKFFKRIAY